MVLAHVHQCTVPGPLLSPRLRRQQQPCSLLWSSPSLAHCLTQRPAVQLLRQPALPAAVACPLHLRLRLRLHVPASLTLLLPQLHMVLLRLLLLTCLL